MSVNETPNAGIPADDEAPLVLPARRKFSWSAVTVPLAWVLALAVVVLNLIFSSRPSALAPDPAEQDRSDFIMEMQGRYLVGAGRLQSGAANAPLLQQLAALENGPPGRRLKVVVLAGELGGPQEALKRLPQIRTPMEDVLYRLYSDYAKDRRDAPSVTRAERDRLQSDLGWFGELALNPAGGPDAAARDRVLKPATRTMIVFFAAVVGAIGLAIVGAVGLIVLAGCWWFGYIRGGIGTRGRVAVWAEVFALYLLIFLLLSLAFSFLNPPFHRVALSGIAALMGLLALGWARIRGVPWTEIRQAVGWTSGRGLLREIAAGVAAYIMMLPIMAVGLIAMLLLMALARKLPGLGGGGGGDGTPTHPVAPMLMGASWSAKILILILAAVIAPIVEETMFRGVFYRHFREATSRWGGVLSAIVSSTFVGFVFAGIHPQGLLGVPVLMSMAYALTLAREWRGTLIPSMIAHGLNNGLVLTMLILAVS